jgi:DNA-binding transcriptional LysR family regulator
VELRQIRYALAVARARSFSRAAVRLSISQSAVSEQVKLLEEEIGFALFSRTTRGVAVTDRGRTYLQQAERVIGDVMNLGDTARYLRGGASDTLALGLGSGMARLLIPRLYANGRDALDGVRLNITTAPTRTVFEDLHEERIDVGIAVESGPERVPAGLVCERIAEAELALIVHPRDPLAAAKRPVAPARLAGEKIIMSELSVGYGPVVSALFADRGLRPRILAVVDNVETIIAMVAAGAGIAVVPAAAVASEAALRQVKTVALSPRCTVALGLFRRRQPMSRRREEIVARLRAALAG